MIFGHRVGRLAVLVQCRRAMWPVARTPDVHRHEVHPARIQKHPDSRPNPRTGPYRKRGGRSDRGSWHGAGIPGSTAPLCAAEPPPSTHLPGLPSGIKILRPCIDPTRHPPQLTVTVPVPPSVFAFTHSITTMGPGTSCISHIVKGSAVAVTGPDVGMTVLAPL